MSNWIPFLEGEYAVEQAFIVAPDDRAMAVEDAGIEVFQGSGDQRQLKGSGRIRNIHLVELPAQKARASIRKVFCSGCEIHAPFSTGRPLGADSSS